MGLSRPEIRSVGPNQKQLMKGSNRFKIPLPPFLLTYVRKVLSLCLLGCSNVCKMLQTKLKSD